MGRYLGYFYPKIGFFFIYYLIQKNEELVSWIVNQFQINRIVKIKLTRYNLRFLYLYVQRQYCLSAIRFVHNGANRFDKPERLCPEWTKIDLLFFFI